MSTPKPGQIRCPTCLRSTPPAAFCTQCGSPIPASARIRPRGMDRDELDERIRGRRPGDPAFRRGTPLDEPRPGDVSRPQGYVPFQPEPEDRLAAREPEPGGPPRHLDNTPEGFDAEPEPAPPPPAWPAEPPPEAYRPRVPEPPAEAPPPAEEPAAEPPAAPEPPYEPPRYVEPPAPPAPPYAAPQYAAPAGSEDDEPGYEPAYEEERAYPYPYAGRGDDDGRRGGGALPIIGFVALCALALAVGAVLAGVLGGGDNVGQASPTPTVAAASPTPQPTPSATVEASESVAASATPEPTDGPVTFPDGASITVQPCATRDMSFDGCDVDGSVVSGDLWVWIGFDDALGSDTFTLSLRNADQTIDQQDTVLGEILDCPDRCSGYLIGAAYRDLDPGQYVLIVRRNDAFADRADFTVEE